ncbi:MAG: transglycosylase SLT domain-containing protein, partial [Bdellovibrionales bacterium]|nr:transglycosylase SLT domain-containing protein [Bdellovibrionales bacterium]
VHYTKLKALKGLTRTYKLMGKKEDHIKASEQLARYAKSKFLKNKKNPQYVELVHDTYLDLARANWTLGNVRLAKKTLAIITRLIKGKYSLAKIYWIYGRMSEEQQDFKKAIKWYNVALLDNPNTVMKEDLLWSKAWNLRKIKNFKDAINIYEELIQLEVSEDNKSKYKFWLAKTLKDMKDFSRADNFFEDAIADDPLGYYGLLAHRETHEVLKLPTANRKIASEIVTHEDKQQANKYLDTIYLDWLISLGETEISDNFLDHIMMKMNKKDYVTNEEWLAIFHYYAKSGSYLRLFSQLAVIPPEQRKTILAENPNLIFPKPFYEEVAISAQKFGISAEYIYSIMRQESAFNPKARSHMDAFGLMQLLPKVARKYARENNIPFRKAEDLYNPKTSIELGAAHLRQLWDNYDGRFILATASYNANKVAIKNWLCTRFRGDPLEFIEDIPYEETKKYIKLVLRNLIFYKIVNSPDKVISFPNWALNI